MALMARLPPALRIAARMEDNCKRLIGSYNRLFDDFHGTTSQMQGLFRRYVEDLRRQEEEDPHNYGSIRLTFRVFRFAAVQHLLEVCVKLLWGDEGDQLIVQVKCWPYVLPSAQIYFHRNYPMLIDAEGRGQRLKRALADATKLFIKYRPCAASVLTNRLALGLMLGDGKERQCGEPCEEGSCHCLAHFVGAPMERHAKRRRTR